MLEDISKFIFDFDKAPIDDETYKITIGDKAPSPQERIIEAKNRIIELEKTKQIVKEENRKKLVEPITRLFEKYKDYLPKNNLDKLKLCGDILGCQVDFTLEYTAVEVCKKIDICWADPISPRVICKLPAKDGYEYYHIKRMIYWARLYFKEGTLVERVLALKNSGYFYRGDLSMPSWLSQGFYETQF